MYGFICLFVIFFQIAGVIVLLMTSIFRLLCINNRVFCARKEVFGQLKLAGVLTTSNLSPTYVCKYIIFFYVGHHIDVA